MDSNLYEILYGNENELADFSFMEIGKVYRTQKDIGSSAKISHVKHISETPRSNKKALAKSRSGRKL